VRAWLLDGCTSLGRESRVVVGAHGLDGAALVTLSSLDDLCKNAILQDDFGLKLVGERLSFWAELQALVRAERQAQPEDEAGAARRERRSS
jgi:hypothetical protein